MELTGIELIVNERKEQLEKHGYSLERDSIYDNQELIKFSGSIIYENIDLYPWNRTLFQHIKIKPRIEQLAIAGALIAAELDRLLLLEKSITSSSETPAL